MSKVTHKSSILTSVLVEHLEKSLNLVKIKFKCNFNNQSDILKLYYTFFIINIYICKAKQLNWSEALPKSHNRVGTNILNIISWNHKKWICLSSQTVSISKPAK